MSNRRLVAVSWSMPPALYPRSIQVARLLKGLHQAGWSSTVVTIDDRHRTSDPLDEQLRTLYQPFYQTEIVEPRSQQDEAEARRLKSVFGRINALDVNWAVDSAAAARKVAERDGAEVMVTFAQPWRDLFTGLAPGRPQIPWVAHFSDPWIDSLYYRDALDMDRDRDVEAEAAVVRQADRVVFTNQHAADLVMRKYPGGWRRKARVVEHAGDPDLVPADDLATARRPGPFRMAYVGTLLAGRRNLDDVLIALAKLAARIGLRGRIELDVIGAGNGAEEAKEQVAKLDLQSIVTLRPHMPYLDSLAAMRQSDALVLVDAPARTNVFLASKLADYLMANRPIIAITPAVGASADVLRESGFPLLEPGNIDGVSEAIERLLLRHESGAPPLTVPDAVRRRCSLPVVSDAFITVLEDALSERAGRA